MSRLDYLPTAALSLVSDAYSQHVPLPRSFECICRFECSCSITSAPCLNTRFIIVPASVGMFRSARDLRQAAESSDDDDWDTNPDFENDVGERGQRWGAKTIEGSGRVEIAGGYISLSSPTVNSILPSSIFSLVVAMCTCSAHVPPHPHVCSLDALRKEVQSDDAKQQKGADFARGYGGKFGVEADRQDKVATPPFPSVCLLATPPFPPLSLYACVVCSWERLPAREAAALVTDRWQERLWRRVWAADRGRKGKLQRAR